MFASHVLIPYIYALDVLVPGALAQQLLMESTGLTCEDEEDDLDQAKGLKSI